MTEWALVDSGGNLIESYDDESEAWHQLGQIVDREPDALGHVFVVAYDDD